MGLITEFKDFIAKGNAFELAVGVIIGGAFGPVVKSMVDDIIMPVVSIPMGSVDFKNLYLPLSAKGIEALKASVVAGAPVPTLETAKTFGAVISYGNLLNAIVAFIFLMLGVFILVKIVNSMKKQEEAKPAAAPAPSAEVVLLTEIRNALVAKK